MAPIGTRSGSNVQRVSWRATEEFEKAAVPLVGGPPPSLRLLLLLVLDFLAVRYWTLE